MMWFRIRACAALVRLVMWIDPQFMPLLAMEASKLIEDRRRHPTTDSRRGE